MNSMKATRRIAVRTFSELADLALPKFLGLDVIEMVPLKAEETLHNYLRRYFEKISRDNARQFAEQKKATTVDVVPHVPFSDGSES
jgi:histone H3/H4